MASDVCTVHYYLRPLHLHIHEKRNKTKFYLIHTTRNDQLFPHLTLATVIFRKSAVGSINVNEMKLLPLLLHTSGTNKREPQI